MAGIDNLKKALGSVISVINGVDAAAAIDYKQVLKEAIDLDAKELQALADQVKALDLSNDKLEGKIEKAVGDNAKYVILLLQLLKLFIK